MAGNSIGQIFRLTTFGESHSVAIGGVIDGCPAGLLIDEAFVQQELDKRKPGFTKGSTERKEEDKVEFLSGLFEGKTTGTPIGFIIRNKNQRPGDYDHLKDVFRPSHADFTYNEKYGIRDYRGGGRSSARETACRVVAGAIAKLFLNQNNISVQAFVSQIGTVKTEIGIKNIIIKDVYKSPVRCPDIETSEKMIKYLDEISAQGDTAGGQVTCVVKNCPAGLGEPVFDKLHADLGKAMLSINAVKGFEIGSGFNAVEMKGSEHNDAFVLGSCEISTATNFSGGIQGGISNGQDIYFNVAFKPVATIKQKQNTVDTKGNNIKIKASGRHDVCVVPRAVPIVEAMAAITIMDHFLRNKIYSS